MQFSHVLASVSGPVWQEFSQQKVVSDAFPSQRFFKSPQHLYKNKTYKNVTKNSITAPAAIKQQSRTRALRQLIAGHPTYSTAVGISLVKKPDRPPSSGGTTTKKALTCKVTCCTLDHVGIYRTWPSQITYLTEQIASYEKDQDTWKQGPFKALEV